MFFKVAQRGENKWWQYLVTLLVVFIAWQVIGAIPLMIGLFASVPEGEDPIAAMNAFSESMDFSAVGMSPLTGLVLMIIAFGFGILGLWLMIRTLHHRTLKSLVTPHERINMKKIFTAAGLWFSFMLLFEIISFAVDADNYVWQFEPSSFVFLVLICLFLLPIQTSFEELLMRGYLLQGIGNGTGSRVIALVITSLFFGLLHGMNPEVAEFGFGIMMVNYISIGLMLGIMTIMDDSLELALGVHWANNFYGAVFVTFSGSALQTPALFKMQEMNVELMTVAVVVGAVVFLVFLSKYYKWEPWTKLLAPVSESEEEAVA